MDVAALVDERPFDVGVQHVYLNQLRVSSTMSEMNAARALSFQFVDFDDDEWVEWIQHSMECTLDDLATLLTDACRMHPSPLVLAECIKCLPQFVESDWNSWKLFPPQRSSLKSALRFVEQAIDKVALWPDSGPVWDSARRSMIALGCDDESVRKFYLRQLQAVPMPESLLKIVESAQVKFEESVGLKHVAANTDTASTMWRSWSALETSVASDSSAWSEMIAKRSPIDPPEYLGSLYARRVIFDSRSTDAWTDLLSYYTNTICSPKDQFWVLSRAVKNCPYFGEFWLQLSRVSFLLNEDCDRIVQFGSSALRESPGGELYLQKLLLEDANRKLRIGQVDNIQSIRDTFQLSVSTIDSPSLAVHNFIAWLHAETFHPKLVADASVGVVLLGEFLENPEWASKRSAATPLQWVQIAWLARSLTDPGEEADDLELCRTVYTLALSEIEEKHQYIVYEDWKLFEETFGDSKSIDMVGIEIQKRKREISKDENVSKKSRRNNSEGGRSAEGGRTREEGQTRAQRRAENRAQPSTGPLKDSVRESSQDGGRLTSAPTQNKGRPTSAPTEDRSRPTNTNSEGSRRQDTEEKAQAALAEDVPQSSHNVVFVKDLAFSVTEESLSEFLKHPIRVTIVKNSLGKSRGFGYAEFATPELADSAILQSGQLLEGRSLTIVPSNRAITVKRPRVGGQHTSFGIVEDNSAGVVKTNDYFRSLLGKK